MQYMARSSYQDFHDYARKSSTVSLRAGEVRASTWLAGVVVDKKLLLMGEKTWYT